MTAHPRKDIIVGVVLPLAAIALFLIECALFHFPASTGLDVLWLAGLTILPGTLIILLLRQYFQLNLHAHEILSLGCAMGFGIPPLVFSVLHSLEVSHPEIIYYVLRSVVFLAVLILILQRKLRLGFAGQLRAINDIWIVTIGALFFFAVYNLQGFHYAADGSILTRGLFGVDLPFLAGEVHGIRNFGTLRDLHQMGQAWHYHDATYQLLVLFPRERTLTDLAFAAPLVGYALLAFSIFSLVLRLTESKYIAYVSVAMWFLVSGLQGGEPGSYALSPSFVFGSMVFLNVLLLLDIRLKEPDRRKQWVFSAILLYFLIELSQTKLSSFLVIVGGMGLLGLMLLRSERKVAAELLLIVAVSFGIVIVQSATSNPLMPGGDFLIGAPLLGYANHVAATLHVPVSSVNPVSHGLSLRWQSVLIIPFFVFHFLRFVLTDPKILSAIIVLVIFRRMLFQGSKEIVWLLVIFIPLGFLLPVLYSPAWYPLALSFYAPLVAVQSALLLVAIGFGAFVRSNRSRKTSTTLGIVALLFLFGFVLSVRSILTDDGHKADLVPLPLLRAMNALSLAGSDTDVIATRRFDLDTTHDESYYWFSALAGRSVISEGAKYGSLLAAVADTDSEKGLHSTPEAERLLTARRSLLDTIYLSRDSEHVRAAIAASGVSYVLEERQPGEQFALGAQMFGTPFFAEGDCKIWKVR